MVANIVSDFGDRVDEQRVKDLVKQVDPADTDGAEGVAVVAVGDADEAGSALLRVIDLSPVLKGHLEPRLDGRRAVVGVEDPGEAFRRDGRQPSGELDGWDIREAEHGAVGDRPKVVVDVMWRTKGVVVAAIGRQLLTLVDEEMSHIQVLMGGEPVSALEEEVSGILTP